MGDAPVRFFLPIGASALLAEAQVDVLDPSKKFVYDRNTFGRPPANQITMWDRQYADLVNDIAHFGFNSENRRQLFYLADRFEELARANPTHFRLTQLEVIRTHKGIWQSGVYEKLASAVAATRGSSRMQTRPPAELPAGGKRLKGAERQDGCAGFAGGHPGGFNRPLEYLAACAPRLFRCRGKSVVFPSHRPLSRSPLAHAGAFGGDQSAGAQGVGRHRG